MVAPRDAGPLATGATDDTSGESRRRWNSGQDALPSSAAAIANAADAVVCNALVKRADFLLVSAFSDLSAALAKGIDNGSDEEDANGSDDGDGDRSCISPPSSQCESPVYAHGTGSTLARIESDSLMRKLEVEDHVWERREANGNGPLMLPWLGSGVATKGEQSADSYVPNRQAVREHRMPEADPASSRSRSPSSTAARMETLLDRETPRIDRQDFSFMKLPDMPEVLLSYITRLSEPTKTSLRNLNSSAARVGWRIATAEQSVRPRDFSDMTAIKRSYKAMEMLCCLSPTNSRAFTTRITDIALIIVDAFHPSSDANFHHVRAVLQFLLKREPERISDVYLYEHDVERRRRYYRGAGVDDPVPPIFCMIPFLHDPTVGACMNSLLFSSVASQAVTKRRERFRFLQEKGFMETLHGNLNEARFPALVTGTADFLVFMIEEACRVEDSLLLFQEVIGDNRHSRQLVKLIVAGTQTQREAAVRVLHSYLMQATGKEYRRLNVSALGSSLETTLFMPAPSRLGVLASKVQRQLAGEFLTLTRQLCRKTDEDIETHSENMNRSINGLKPSSYSVELSFNSRCLLLLECIYQTLLGAEDPVSLLKQLDIRFYRTLVDWFFAYKYNNLYHCLFYKICYFVLRIGHQPSMKNLLTRTQMLRRMIDQYESKESTGNKGHILLICNTIRLCGESQSKSDYIPQMLETHTKWRDFEPRLRAETEKQLNVPQTESCSFNIPVPYQSPLKKTEVINRPNRLSGKPSDFPSGGSMGFGSRFALALGFPSECFPTPSPTLPSESLLSPRMATARPRSPSPLKPKRKSRTVNVVSPKHGIPERIDEADDVESGISDLSLVDSYLLPVSGAEQSREASASDKKKKKKKKKKKGGG